MPEPETPVTATSAFLGMSTEICFRLCSRAPTIRIVWRSRGCAERRAAAAHARALRLRDERAQGPRTRAPSQRLGQGLSGRRVEARDRLGRALADDAAPGLAGLGSEVHDPVGRLRQRHVVLDHDHRVAGVDQPSQRADQHRDVGRVQACRRLVEQVQPVLASAGLGQRLGELQPLGLAARERRRGLRQREVAEAEVQQRLERGRDAPVISEDPRHLGGGQVERVRDREAAAADLEYLGPEAAPVAGAAAHVGVRQELQLDLLVAGALADRAGAGRGVEREGRGLEAALLGLGRRGEDLAQRLEDAHVRRGVHARAGAERGLVDERDAGERLGAVDPVAGAGLGLADAEVPAQVAEEHLVDERRLAGARDARDAHEPAERQLDRHVLQVVLSRAADAQAIRVASGARRRRGAAVPDVGPSTASRADRNRRRPDRYAPVSDRGSRSRPATGPA